MAFTKERMERALALHALIEGNKEHEHAAPTYRDSAYMRELGEIALSEEAVDIETLEDKGAILRYVGENYRKMCRPSVAAGFFEVLLDVHIALSRLKTYGKEETAAMEEAFFLAVKTRNFYVNDACDDLLERVRGILPDARIEKLYDSGKNSRIYKNDPVEMTEEYLAVIDEVERLVDENKEMDFCLETWSLKGQYLAERGIRWTSPAILNPSTRFD